MKKIFILFLLISMSAIVYSQTGIIREIAGDVELKSAGSSVFVRAQSGSHVEENTIVSTGFRSTAVIAVGSSLITVQPLTRLTLSEIQSSSGVENLNVNLQSGRIRVDVKPPAGTRVSTIVQSPSATASVRGTILEMDIYNLDVVEGTVNWSGSDNVPVSVSKGSSTISIDGSAGNPISLSSIGLLPSLPVGAGLSGETLPVSNTVPPPVNGNLDIKINW